MLDLEHFILEQFVNIDMAMKMSIILERVWEDLLDLASPHMFLI